MIKNKVTLSLMLSLFFEIDEYISCVWKDLDKFEGREEKLVDFESVSDETNGKKCKNWGFN